VRTSSGVGEDAIGGHTGEALAGPAASHIIATITDTEEARAKAGFSAAASAPSRAEAGARLTALRVPGLNAAFIAAL
jgi:hypothetical protein